MDNRRHHAASKSGYWLGVLAAASILTACGGGSDNEGAAQAPPPPPPPPAASAYSMSSLISDGSVAAVTTDVKLKNPWGLVFAANAPAWVANNATQVSTLYDGTGGVLGLVVSLPGGINGAADATGIVANPTTEFTITNGTVTAAARFIFDGEGGTIMAWSPTVNATNALITYDDGAGGAAYKGLAMASDNGANFLYATDFHNNKVDVFDKAFAKVATAGGFTDPNLPAGYAPFGIQALTVAGTTSIYVTYAQKQAASNDNVNGAGLGLVNVFDTKGTFQKRLVTTGGQLNAPWGVALAPASFGTLSGKLLIGNFGDGVINAFDPATGAFVDSVKNAAGTAIANPGLWAIAFGNGARNQPTGTLYFTAGIANEIGGLYGRIDLGATAPDIVPPTVALSAPAAAANVSGTVPVTATAADNVGVVSVQFFAGATSIGTATTAPYTVNWDTTTAAVGPVSLTAQAKDAFGNVTTSAVVAVTVSAVAPPAAVTLTQLQANVFTPRCSGCHSGGGATLPASMNLSSAAATFAAIVDVASIEQPGVKRIAPNDADNSYLVRKIRGTAGIGGVRMPANGPPFLDDATIADVAAWVAAGALNN